MLGKWPDFISEMVCRSTENSLRYFRRAAFKNLMNALTLKQYSIFIYHDGCGGLVFKWQCIWTGYKILES